MESARNIETYRTLVDARIDILCVKWSFDDSTLAVSCSDGNIKTYASSSFHINKILSIRTVTTMPFTSCCWVPSPDLLLVAVSADGFLVQWNAMNGKLMKSRRADIEQGLCCDLNPGGTLLAVGTNTFDVHVHDAGSFMCRYYLLPGKDSTRGHTNRVFAVKWIDEENLLTGGWDDIILLWNVPSASVIKSFYKAHIIGNSIDVRNNNILVGSYDRKDQLQVINYVNSDVEYSECLEGENNIAKVFSCQFSKFTQGMYFALVGDKIRFYDAKEFVKIYEEDIQTDLFSCDWAHMEDMVAVAGQGGILKILAINSV